MSTQPLPLSVFCDVQVTATPIAPVVPTFNQSLFTGTSTTIPSIGANSRCRDYASVADAIADGFDPTDPEIIELGLYFAQSPAPQIGWLGRQDLTALQTIVPAAGNEGTDYVVGDLVVVVQGSAAGGIVEITAVDPDTGAATAAVVVSGEQGTGYSVANGLATTGGSGTGFKVNITVVGETVLQAITACRLAQPAWYTASATNSTDADDIACAQFAQTATPQMQYLYGTQSASALNGTAGNVFSTIKGMNLSRAHGAYSTVQGGAAPNNLYIAGAIAGRAMGLNTGLANSNFTLDAKALTGIVTEPLSLAQINKFAGTPGQSLGNNGNCYVNVANTYNFYIQGVNGNGTFFDQVLGLDMLAADAQLSVVTALATMNSIPQDNGGQSILLSAVNGACARSAARGFLAGGTWTGPTVLAVTAGTSLPLGYLAQSDLFTNQSAADRALRKGMPIYITVILAGSQQSFTIGIFVQQ